MPVPAYASPVDGGPEVQVDPGVEEAQTQQ